jgi:hypothetical protein
MSFPGLVQKKLFCVCPDHTPILLTKGATCSMGSVPSSLETYGLKMRVL